MGSVRRTYRSRDGRHLFVFDFVDQSTEVEVYCRQHPLHRQDADPHKTHLFRSGKLCFVSGRAPTTLSRAQQLAGQWAEYFLEYQRSGQVQA